MDQNTQTTKERPKADQLREQIRHTESDITETVHTLEQRMSPGHLRRKATRKAKIMAWQGAATFLAYAQRTPVQVSLLGVAALLAGLGKRRHTQHQVLPKPGAKEERKPVAAAAGLSALMLLGKRLVRGAERKPAASGISLAATAAKGFFSGARGTRKTGTTQPGRKLVWRNLATALGVGLGSYWYSHRGRRV
jgi:hypothetical protein